MTTLKPWAMGALDGAPAYSSLDIRRVFTGLLSGIQGSSFFRARAGVLGPRGFSTSATGLQITVGQGLCVVDTSQGAYVTGVVNPETFTLTARHGTWSRVDKVCIVIKDTTTDRSAEVVIVEGVPSASPVAGATPANAIEVRQVTVPPSGNLSVADSAVYTGARGAVIPVPNASARLRMTATAEDPILVHQTDTGSIWRNAGGGWLEVASSPDKGWTSLNAYRATGWGNFTGDEVQYKIVGGTAFVRGRLTRSGTSGNNTLLESLPTEMRPSRDTLYAAAISTTGYGTELLATAAGSIVFSTNYTVGAASIGSGATIPISGSWALG